MKRAMSNRQILNAAAHHKVAGTDENIIAFAKHLLKKGSDADILQYKVKGEAPSPISTPA